MSAVADFSETVAAWLETERAVQSAVLFGSAARRGRELAAADGWSDLDLHIVTTDVTRLEQVDWARALPAQTFCLQVVRPATGGVHKVTVLFTAGQLDLVLVPATRMRAVQRAMDNGRHKGPDRYTGALNEMATCLATGYRFLKGEAKWGEFYRRVAAEMQGVRLGDDHARNLADIFLCELVWVLQKIERGELAAAQHALHRSLAETNFRLLRELRLRLRLPLPSFGLARRVESMLSPNKLSWVKVDARHNPVELRRAASATLVGLIALMRELVPTWQITPNMRDLLTRHGASFP